MTESHDDTIRPGHLYPMKAICRILERSPIWVRKHLMQPGQCIHIRKGDAVLFLGDWLIGWATRNAIEPLETADAEPKPRKTRRKKAKGATK